MKHSDVRVLTTRLRLVGADTSADATSLRHMPAGEAVARRRVPVNAPPGRAAGEKEARRAVGEVAKENHLARIGADDARAVFAGLVADSLEGGRAAMLRPEVRRTLAVSAQELGIRSFDANLAIAAVQDAARRGERVTSNAVPAAVMHLAPVRRDGARNRIVMLALAAMLGAAIFIALVLSVLRG